VTDPVEAEDDVARRIEFWRIGALIAVKA